MPEPKFAGAKIEIGGTTYVVPPIALGKMKELRPRIESLDFAEGKMPSSEAIDTITDMVLAALNRNYPDMTRAELEDLLDLGNMGEIMKVVAGQSGLVERGK